MLRFLHDELAPNAMHMERREIYHHFAVPAAGGFCLCSPEFFLGSGLTIYLGMKASVGPLKCSTGGGGPSRMGLGLATTGAWYSQINNMEGWSQKLRQGPGFPPSSPTCSELHSGKNSCWVWWVRLLARNQGRKKTSTPGQLREGRSLRENRVQRKSGLETKTLGWSLGPAIPYVRNLELVILP